MKLVYGIICRLRKTTRYLLRLFIIKFHSYIRALGGGGWGRILLKSDVMPVHGRNRNFEAEWTWCSAQERGCGRSGAAVCSFPERAACVGLLAVCGAESLLIGARGMKGVLFPLGNPRFPEASADVNSKREWMNGRSHNESQNHAFFWAERPRREKLSHRSPYTIVGALRKFELHRCLLRCERKCKGSGVCWTQIWDARASSRRWGILEFSHSRAIVA